MKKYLIETLQQPSSWVGIIGFLSLLGVALSPEQSTAIESAGVAMASAIAAFVKW